MKLPISHDQASALLESRRFGGATKEALFLYLTGGARTKATAARAVGVSPSVVTRALHALALPLDCCPHCGQIIQS